jgi:ribonuclease P protein component
MLRGLRKRRQFLAAAKGRSCARGSVVIQSLARGDEDSAIGVGFTATKKIGGAVVRNRAKRRLREAARRLLPLHGEARHDYVFIARSGCPERDWTLLLDDITRALAGLKAGGDAPPSARRPKPARSTASHRHDPDG